MYTPGSMIWKKISSDWWQKIFINSAGKPKFTYHYKSKSSESCRVLVLNTKVAKRLSGYMLLDRDIRECKELFRLYQKITKHDAVDDNKTLIKAIVKAVIITYGKCFVQAGGRKIKLDAKHLSDNNKKAHTLLMEMRHQFIAHAGRGFEECNLIYVIPPEKKIKAGQTVSSGIFSELTQLVFFESFSSDVEPLLKDIHNRVQKEIVKIKSKLDEQFSNVSVENLAKFKLKNGKRVNFNDNDIEITQHNEC